jgi:glyoxylase-like metal-dependent hydrolase (beta-lactamase superfamily II)
MRQYLPMRVLGLMPAFAATWAMQASPACGQGPIDVVHVNGPIYLLVGAGGNVAASVGPDGVLLVDSGSIEMSGVLLRTVETLSEEVNAVRSRESELWGAEGRSSVLTNRNAPPPHKPIRYIINTNASPERIGGNEVIGAAGVTYTGGNVAGTIGDAGEGAAIWAHEAVLFALVERDAPFGMLPTNTYYGASTKLSHFFNGDGVRMVHMPAAQSEGATIVQFTRSDVIVTGDFFSQTTYPMIDLERGGSIDGVINALNYVLDLAVPEFRTEGGTMIIPAYGRLSDSADVGYYRDMVTIIRNNIQEMITRGMSLRQIHAARPTRAYDARFGADSGPWTTDMFVEAVYRSLAGNE